jgi:chromosome segregation ATPase
MANISLWKRVGGWLRRSPETVGPAQGKVIRVDADGMLVNPENDLNPEDSTALSKPAKNEKQTVSSMEEGFNRLVDVLESINDNVVQQRQHSADMTQRLDDLNQSMRALPESTESQSALKDLTEELRSQSLRQQQVSDSIKPLPDLSQAQVDKLSDITRQLEAAGENEIQLVESFNRVQQSMQGMETHSTAQTSALRDMGAASAHHSQQLQEVLAKQNRKLIWCFAVLAALLVVAIAAIAVLLLMTRNSPTT